MQFKYARKIRFSDVISTPVTPRNEKENRTSVMKPLKHGLIGAAIGTVVGGVAGQAVTGNPVHALNLGIAGMATGLSGGTIHGAYNANKGILQGRANRGEKLVTKKELRDFHNRPVQYHNHW